MLLAGYTECKYHSPLFYCFVILRLVGLRGGSSMDGGRFQWGWGRCHQAATSEPLAATAIANGKDRII